MPGSTVSFRTRLARALEGVGVRWNRFCDYDDELAERLARSRPFAAVAAGVVWVVLGSTAFTLFAVLRAYGTPYAGAMVPGLIGVAMGACVTICCNGRRRRRR